MSKQLKCDFHVHTDSGRYSFETLIKSMSKKRYDVVAITNHNKVTFNNYYKRYAKKRNIFLIPGVERTVEGKHVLLLDIKKEVSDKIKTFEDIRKQKQKNGFFVIAPHPFNYFVKASLRNKLIENLDLFDAIEFSSVYTRFINPNRRAVKIARKENKPMVGNSDTHFLGQLDKTFTYIDSDVNIDSIFSKIIKKQTYIVTRPYFSLEIAGYAILVKIFNVR